MTVAKRGIGVLTIAAFMLASCGGGGASTSSSGGTTPTDSVPASTDITVSSSVFTTPAAANLTSADVGKIVAQAAEEAAARGKPAVIAVTDRTGNVLAVFQMTGAPSTLTVGTQTNERAVTPGDLEGLNVPGNAMANPVVLAAIAKAVTGAYLSSAGNAFSTRTASYIVQEHFPKAPNTIGLESGPLFGTQFSSTPCSDMNAHYTPGGSLILNAVSQIEQTVAANIGPKRSPLGLSADPGGIPLYKNGVVVGGLGVMSDGLYSYDGNSIAVDSDPDEYIAIAGATGYDAPDSIRANRISIDGTLLAYLDASATDLKTTPASARAFAAINGTLGSLVSVRGYYAQGVTPTLLDGSVYGTEASGIRAATAAERSAGTVVANPDAFILTDGSGNNRFPIRAGTDAADVAQPLTAAEVKAIQEEAFLVMARARGAIRKPDDSRAQVTLSIVDTHGSILAVARAPDAPLFGIDVSLEKARTVAFFSNAKAAADLSANTAPGFAGTPSVASYVGAANSFIGQPGFLTGQYAVSDRLFGLLSRPYFPDGQVNTVNGPFSRPFAAWSPFSDGLQSTLVTPNIVQHVLYVLGLAATDTAHRCTATPLIAGKNQSRLQNGIQIFPGATPIYRGNVLVGAIGISGDGIDQDDMISFLGLYNASVRPLSVGLAPLAMRASNIQFPQANNARLPYVQCPVQEFVGSTRALDICSGK